MLLSFLVLFLPLFLLAPGAAAAGEASAPAPRLRADATYLGNLNKCGQALQMRAAAENSTVKGALATLPHGRELGAEITVVARLTNGRECSVPACFRAGQALLSPVLPGRVSCRERE